MKFKTILRNVFASVCVAAALAAVVAPHQASAKKNKKIGIQLYSVMSAVQKDPKASIERLADLGYNNVELVQWGGDTKVFGMAPADFKALCDGVDYTEAGLKQMCDYFNRIGKIAAEYGLMLGYHNHSGEYNKLKDSDKVMWEYLVENTDPRYVCFELDVYWCTKGGKNPVEYLKKYPKRIKMLHVKDDFVIGESGDIDFESIFKQFCKNGMKDYVVEIETPGWLRNEKNADGSKLTQEQIMERVFDAARKSADYLSAAKFVK